MGGVRARAFSAGAFLIRVDFIPAEFVAPCWHTSLIADVFRLFGTSLPPSLPFQLGMSQAGAL